MTQSNAKGSLSKKGFVKNYLLNAVGFALITGTVQLLLYPYLSRIMNQADYGVAIMFIGFTNLFTAVFALSLTNARFRRNLEYAGKKLVGDFKLLFYSGLILNIIFVTAFCLVYKPDTSLMDILLLVIMTGLAHYRSYYSVQYRLNLDFKKILAMSFFICIGYVAGMVASNITGVWQFSFIVGELAGSVYVYFTGDLSKEPAQKTELFKNTSIVYIGLIVMTVFTSIPMYADRLIIYPLLSSEDVAVYYVASFYGKTVGAATTPLAGVFISYYALQNALPVRSFLKKCFYVIIITAAFALSALFLSKTLTGIFYPTIINDTVPYLGIANFAVILYFAVAMVTPAMVRFCSLKLLLIVRGISAGLYIGLSIIMINGYGLLGFCYAMLAVNFLTFAAMVVIGVLSLRKKGIIVAT